MKSHARASSKPPVTAAPLTAAMVGTSDAAAASMKRGRSRRWSTPRLRRSRPAQNAGSEPVITMAPASWQPAMASTVCPASSAFMALRASGRSRTMRATSPWRSMRTRSVIALAGHGVAVLADAVPVAVDIGLAGVVGGHREVGGPRLPPLGGVALPALGGAPGELRLGLDAEAVHRPARLLPHAAHVVDQLPRLVG